jgi:hypothetical protein
VAQPASVGGADVEVFDVDLTGVGDTGVTNDRHTGTRRLAGVRSMTDRRDWARKPSVMVPLKVICWSGMANEPEGTGMRHHDQ